MSDDPTAAVAAVLAARDASGMAREDWQKAQRDAFAVFAFGVVSCLAAARGQAADTVPDEVVHVLRAALKLSFKEATALADAIVESITGEPPHPAASSLVRCGWLAGQAWLRDDRAGFDAQVVQASASDAYASDRPLL